MIPVVVQTVLTLLILTNQMNFEIASTPDERRLGLMYRQVWGNTDGMFFIHERPGRVAYWMKNTYLDMRMLYLDGELNLIDVKVPTPLSTDPLYSSTTNIHYVLEIRPELLPLIRSNYGTFRRQLAEQLHRVSLPPGTPIPELPEN